MKNEKNVTANGFALIPFLVFIILYLGVGLILQSQGVEMAFYQLSSPVAILVGIIVGFIIFKGSIDEKISDFLKGCGDENILTMCVIYLLAGAFASVAGAMGGVENVANLGLSFIPPEFIAAGIFIIAGFLSISTGSSMGTIGTIGPIALATAEKGGISIAIMSAAVVGGAMFGDNLSIISDTTIAATKTQGCDMRDKFKVNFFIALPAAIIAFILLLLFAKPETQIVVESLEYNILKVLPYLFVLIIAVLGVNVFLTLGIGVIIAGIIGLLHGDFTLLSLSQSIYSGFTGMTEIFLLSFFTGGLAYMVTKNGGLEWVLQKIQGLIRGKKTAELGIGAISSVCDLATANNTVAIIIAGPIAKSIADKYEIPPKKSASLLDIWSCVFQGIIPYGAQILLMCSLTAVTASPLSPINLIPLLWYQQLLAVCAIISVFVTFNKK